MYYNNYILAAFGRVEEPAIITRVASFEATPSTNELTSEGEMDVSQILLNKKLLYKNTTEIP